MMPELIIAEPRTAAIQEGLPHPRGASWDGKGTNFALFSDHATKVEGCIFDDHGKTSWNGLTCRNTRTRSFTAIFLMSVRARFTGIACTDRTNLRTVTASIRTSYFLTRMQWLMSASS